MLSTMPHARQFFYGTLPCARETNSETVEPNTPRKYSCITGHRVEKPNITKELCNFCSYTAAVHEKRKDWPQRPWQI